MKTLQFFINEALGDVTPKQFMDIWKGKNPKIDDTEHLKNAKYVIHEIMNVHKDKLPTEEEFENLCNWVIDQNWNATSIEMMLNKMFETFINLNSINEFGLHDLIDSPAFVNASKTKNMRDDFINMAPFAFFYSPIFKHKIENEWSNSVSAYTVIFQRAFKKYKVSWESWPNYTKGMKMIKDHLGLKY